MSHEPCRQCGGRDGDHFTSCPTFQPVNVTQKYHPMPVPDPINPPYYEAGGIKSADVVDAYGLGRWESLAVKYILRAGKKGPPITDWRKAIWCLERVIKNAGGGR